MWARDANGRGADPPPGRRRNEAIGQALAAARRGHVVVIAGEGHEQGQEFEGGRKIPFDDVSVARQALRSAMAAR